MWLEINSMKFNKFKTKNSHNYVLEDIVIISNSRTVM